MRIEKITTNKKQFLDLLLLADEQENIQLIDMIYLKKNLWKTFVLIIIPVREGRNW